jgi:hypothetical protein
MKSFGNKIQELRFLFYKKKLSVSTLFESNMYKF